jgi:hypothetical protein
MPSSRIPHAASPELDPLLEPWDSGGDMPGQDLDVAAAAQNGAPDAGVDALDGNIGKLCPPHAKCSGRTSHNLL